MSNITHLYHLSALDFINTTSFPGMAPWTPSYTASDMLVATGLTDTTTNKLVMNYVDALAIRRKCHTAGALFSGRQPIQNAMVPGGVTTLFSTTHPYPVGKTNDYDTTGYDGGGPFNATETRSKFKALLTDIRAFINTKYIPDVLTVASVFSQYWSVGKGCQRLLSYGDYPLNSSGKMLIKRGVVSALTPGTFNQSNIAEYVDTSYYNYGVTDAKGLHPFFGKTNPNMNDTKSTGYSWIKAPRLMNGTTPEVCEVGPLARMVVTYLSTNQQTVSESDMNVNDTLGNVLGAGALASYNVTSLVNYALGHALNGSYTSPPSTAQLALLYSPLGRHAARALEAKYLSDALADWVDELQPDAPCYTYAKIPKQIATGYGLTEAPRGALGHWIKIEGRKVAKYQCVVPSTWNFGPSVGTVTDYAKANRGPVEQSLMDTNIGNTPTAWIINILRVVHPFDCCIACAVHVVNPEGKEMMKFAIGPDGRPTNIEVKE